MNVFLSVAQSEALGGQLITCRWFLSAITSALLVLAFFGSARGQTFNVLHTFDATASDPLAGLTLSGNSLYGTTDRGGANGDGTVFSMNISGGPLTILHSFAGGATDGSDPATQLTIAGSTIYGSTDLGGPSGGGTVFSLSTGGGPTKLLCSFVLEPTESSAPSALTLSGSTLFGVTSNGGPSNHGTVFSVSTSGGTVNQLHAFSYTPSDGQDPNGGVILSGNTLYGTTFNGGAGGQYAFGTVYSVSATGGPTTLLNSFVDYPADMSNGGGPDSNLVLDGSTLYGTAFQGGPYNSGVVFKVNIDGSGFQVLHAFDDADGSYVYNGLTLVGSTLYGTSDNFDAQNYGEIFSLSTDGSDFQILHTFSASDGGYPSGDLLFSGSTLYGTTGGTNGYGEIYSLSVPEPSSLMLFIIGAAGACAIGFVARRTRSSRSVRIG